MAIVFADEHAPLRTVEEFLAAHGDDADGYRREFVDGTVLVSPWPTSRHQRLSSQLWLALEQAGSSRGLRAYEAVNVRLSETRLVVPDVVLTGYQADFVALDARHVALAVEIVSPGSATRDSRDKPALYAAAGIPHFLHVDPGATIAGHPPRRPPRATWYRLAHGSYAAAATSDRGVLQLAAPVTATLDLQALLTR